jgi:hypothetical protein
MPKPRPINFRALNDGCLICTSHRSDNNGYPVLSSDNRKQYIHRYLFLAFHSLQDLPATIIVRHDCDRRDCINVLHLRTGTRADNSRDMVTRDRSAKHERHWKAKLTAASVRAIRTSNLPRAQLAHIFGITPNYVNALRRGINWEGINDEPTR